MNTSIYFSLEKWSKRQLKPSDFVLQSMQFLPCSYPKLPSAFSQKIVQLADLVHLALNDCQLESLEQFPKMKWLARLELKNNRINGKELRHLVGLDGLVSLWLSKNLIERVEDVAVLGQLPELMQLDLKGNPLRHTNNYFYRVFEMMQNLIVLDDRDCEGDRMEMYSVIDVGVQKQIKEAQKGKKSEVKSVKSNRVTIDQPKSLSAFKQREKRTNLKTPHKNNQKKPQLPKVPPKIFKEQPIANNTTKHHPAIIILNSPTKPTKQVPPKPNEAPQPQPPEPSNLQTVQVESSSDIDLSD